MQHSIAWFGAIALPATVAIVLIRSATMMRRNTAGHSGLWRRHVLSYGPATVALGEEGIALRSVQHELLLKPAGVVQVLESGGAFSVLAEDWEIVIPKRMMDVQAVARWREALQKRLGEVRSLSGRPVGISTKTKA